MTDKVDTPIRVRDSSMFEQATTLARYMVTAGGTYAIAKGWITDEGLQFALGILTIGLPTAYGMYRTWKVNEQKKTMEPFVPEQVATKA